MQIDPEVQIDATKRPGTVYYFPEDSFGSDEPHYFVVLNAISQVDEKLLLVNATSQIEKRKKQEKTSQIKLWLKCHQMSTTNSPRKLFLTVILS